MYFNKNNNFYHGVTFHLFHDNIKHKPSPGSVDKDAFYNILKFIGLENIINADEFIYRSKENKLKPKDICITLDDGNKSQYDIALPVLENQNIKSFFFIYSSIFDGSPDLLEIYRFFRVNFFKNIDQFYRFFFKKINKNINKFLEKKTNEINFIKKKFPYYSINDIRFRITRDKFLTKKEYTDIMQALMNEKNFNYKDYYDLLFINKKELKNIYNLGHKIGLHSHTHPTRMSNLNYNNQLQEFKINRNKMSKILNIKNKQINSASFPSGSYNNDTIKIFKKLGIEIAFRNQMFVEGINGLGKINNSPLEIARQDHAQILLNMKLKNY